MDQVFNETETLSENQHLFMDHDGFDEGRVPQHLIHLAELTVERLPVDTPYLYTCRVTVDTDFERQVLVRELEPRAIPYWMLDLQHLGECRVTVAVLYRGTGDDEPWRIAGSGTMNSAEDLSSDTAATAILGIESWSEAPQLKVRLRFLHHPTVGSHQAHLTPRRPDAARGRGVDLPDLSAVAAISLPEAPTLTSQEEVILKDTWNKLLAFKDLSLEFFLKRLLVQSPDLVEVFGDAVSGLMEHFGGLFDLTIRQLNPATEHILREAYRGSNPGSDLLCNSVAEYGADFARLGMRPRHWLTARNVFQEMIAGIPYIEEYESKNLELGEGSAFHRFFTGKILHPMLEALAEHSESLPEAKVARLRQIWEHLGQDPLRPGVELFKALFRQHPEATRLLGGVDIDRMANQFMGSFDQAAHLMAGWSPWLPESVHGLPESAGAGRDEELPFTPAAWFQEPMAEVLTSRLTDGGTEAVADWRALCERLEYAGQRASYEQTRLFTEAQKYLRQIAVEFGWETDALERRLAEVEREVEATGTYTHTYEELAFGARLAWRNASKCVGRLSWKSLMVRDCRHVTHPDEMFEHCLDHLRIANNGGKIQPMITLFRPCGPTERWGPRLWNSQLIRYAGYRNPDGSVLGDPANASLTTAILGLGWMPPHPRTPYDILPLVIDVPGKQPSLHELPKELILEVKFEHPTVPQFAELGLKWYAVPAISNFRLDIGGVIYSCCPFNGWYLCTELGRNFTDTSRYNRTEDIAKVLGLDTSNDQTLWRDEVILHLNRAVIHSFVKNKVVLTDHHQVGRQFLTHDLREKKAGRECPGQWSWVVPPQGGSVCPIYHHEMRDFLLKPEYRYGADRWAVEDGNEESGFFEDHLLEDEMRHDLDADLVVLHASETGTAETLARQTARRLRHFRVRVMPLDEFQIDDPGAPKLMLIVAATGHQGLMALGGRWFLDSLRGQAEGTLRDFHYAVMAVGSRAYDGFCAAGEELERELSRLGASAVTPLHRGDVLGGLDANFNAWLTLLTRRLGEDPSSAHTDTSRPAVWLEVELAQPTGTAAPRAGVFGVPVIERQPLRSSQAGSSREGTSAVHSLVLDLAGTELQYESGDRVAVYPRNPDELVQRLCRRVGLAPAMGFTAHYFGRAGQTDQAPPVPVPSTIGQLFSAELDLGLTEPYTELIAYLHGNAQSEIERRRLETWLGGLRHPGSSKGRETREALRRTYPSVVDLLEALPSVEVHLADLIELLPKQRPRFYTAASTPTTHPTQLRLVVEETGGLCAQYLAGLSPEKRDKVRIQVGSSSLRPRQALSAPTLLVAEDAGVSSFLGLLQHRDERAKLEGPAAPTWLFCAYRGELPCGSELADWQERSQSSFLASAPIGGSHSGIHDSAGPLATGEAGVALERLIEHQGVGVWQMLNHPESHYYASASVHTLAEMHGVLLRVACLHGGLSYSAAVEFFDRMKAEQRFNTEVRGLGDLATVEAASLTEARAELWLRRFQDQVA